VVKLKKYLDETHPDLCKEWDYERNGNITPNNVTFGSGRIVSWICETCNYRWKAKVVKRTRRSQGCPSCAGRVANDTNNLKTLRPDLAEQWDCEKNGSLTPSNITFRSNKKVWWKCDVCDYEWKTTPNHRARSNDSKCPCCNGKTLTSKNRLSDKYPKIALEWDYNKNLTTIPRNVFVGTHEKYWWICPNGHSYESAVYSRVEGKGCPECSKGRKTSFPEQAIYYYIKQIFQDSENRHNLVSKNGVIEVDIYIPSLKLAIEYDGFYFHRKTQEKDELKSRLLKRESVIVIRVRESGLSMVDDSINVNDADCNQSNLNETVSKVLQTILDIKRKELSDKQIKSLESIDVCVENHRGAINQNLVIENNENNLLLTHPIISSEWSDKNGSLLPSHVTYGSQKYVWWICKKCNHEWEAKIHNRTIGGTGCPYCAGHKHHKENSLGVLYPESLEEWHPTKNGDMTPFDVTKGTSKKYWFLVRGKEKYTSPASRVTGYKYKRKINKKLEES
jgi:rubrerythrin